MAARKQAGLSPPQDEPGKRKQASSAMIDRQQSATTTSQAFAIRFADHDVINPGIAQRPFQVGHAGEAQHNDGHRSIGNQNAVQPLKTVRRILWQINHDQIDDPLYGA